MRQPGMNRMDFAVEAVDHALAAKDYDLAAQLIEQNTYPLVTRGELATLIRWIEALPAEVNRRPHFLLAKAWALLFAGDAVQIGMLLGQMDAQIEPGQTSPEVAELQGSAAAIRAFFALMAGDHVHALQLAEQAEKLLPPAASKADQPNPFLYAAHSVLPYTLRHSPSKPGTIRAGRPGIRGGSRDVRGPGRFAGMDDRHDRDSRPPAYAGKAAQSRRIFAARHCSGSPT